VPVSSQMASSCHKGWQVSAADGLAGRRGIIFTVNGLGNGGQQHGWQSPKTSTSYFTWPFPLASTLL